MRYFYDLEFLEDGLTIDPISIGVVAEDGREYYAVNSSVDWHGVMDHDWLPGNVVPHLPTWVSDDGYRLLDMSSTVVQTRKTIQTELWEFFRPNPDEYRDTQLWAWCGAYDHVALCQILGGPMVGLHGTGMPFYTNDLKSLTDLFLPREFRYVDTEVNTAGAHNALADARSLRDRFAQFEAAFDGAVAR